MNSVNYTNKNHSIGLNQFHLEWCPKYRYKCMGKPDINKTVEKLIIQSAEEHKIIIHSIAVGIDHVHVFVSLPFDMSLSKALNFLKGRSAYLIFRRFPNFRLRYPKGHFWSAGKFGRSISNITSKTVKNYIENQQFDKLHETIDNIKEEPMQLNLTSFL